MRDRVVARRMRVCLCLLVFVLGVAGPRMVCARQGSLWIMYAASSGDAETRGIGWWSVGWDRFAVAVEKHVAALREEGFNVEGVQIHHPWGRTQGATMEFEQRMHCYFQYARTRNPTLGAALDDKAFTRAMTQISRNVRVMIYMGSPHQLNPMPGEPKKYWVRRALQVYGPVLDIRPPVAIGMDATYGQPAEPNPSSRFNYTGGPDGSVAQLVGNLLGRGHQIYFEGAILYNADWARHLCNSYTTDQFWWVPNNGTPHAKPGWGRWARPGVETYNTTMIQLANLRPFPNGTDDQKRIAINTILSSGIDVAVPVTLMPGFPWR